MNCSAFSHVLKRHPFHPCHQYSIFNASDTRMNRYKDIKNEYINWNFSDWGQAGGGARLQGDKEGEGIKKKSPPPQKKSNHWLHFGVKLQLSYFT